MTDADSSDAQTFWEARYASSEAVWSGRVNTVVREVAESLEPGLALDLGCGEGGDAVWLASRGWLTVGVDLSDTAAERARTAAASVGLGANAVSFVAADLSEWTTTQTFNFVTIGVSSLLAGEDPEVGHRETQQGLRGAGRLASCRGSRSAAPLGRRRIRFLCELPDPGKRSRDHGAPRRLARRPLRAPRARGDRAGWAPSDAYRQCRPGAPPELIERSRLRVTRSSTCRTECRAPHRQFRQRSEQAEIEHS